MNIGTRDNYDDGRTIIMEPIRSEDLLNNQPSNVASKQNNNTNNNLYTKSDFENDYDDEDEDCLLYTSRCV